MSAQMHSHSVANQCTEKCPRFDPKGWRCAMCLRQVPMFAATEKWDRPICVECFDRLPNSSRPRVSE